MNVPIIIGVDHGYAAMKTAHFSFHTGLVAHEHEPYTLNNVLEYGGKYYVVGSGRQPLQKDKTQTEDYYLLTLAAVAKELVYRNAGTAADIHLAAGLPVVIVQDVNFLHAGSLAFHLKTYQLHQKNNQNGNITKTNTLRLRLLQTDASFRRILRR